MAEKRYQVFISSTFTDLSDERDTIIRGLLDVDCFPAGMEMFVASDESQWEVIKREIDESDYYLVISAGRYGSIDPDTGLSFTEKEYRYAIDSKTPVAAFLRKDIGSLPSDQCEQEPELRKRLEEFHDLLKQDKMVSQWSEKNELRNLVTLSILRLMKIRPAIGWIRADAAADPELYQHYISLTEELDDLKNELAKYKNKENNISPEYEWYDTEATFSGWIHDGSHTEIATWTAKVWWSLLFIMVGRIITHSGPQELNVINTYVSKSLLNSHQNLLDGEENRRVTVKAKKGHTKAEVLELSKNALIYENQMVSLIAQCIVHNLVREENGKYSLTEFGRKHYFEAAATKK